MSKGKQRNTEGEAMPATFAEALNRAIEQSGMTKYRLAQVTGLSAGMVTNIASGKNSPGWETAVKLALALGVSLDSFLSADITLPEEQPAKKLGRPKKEPE